MPLINTAITLKDLPPPPTGKIGWPWTEQTEALPERMPDSSEWPRITIVTPSYNQGQFIEETIRSVLLQGYPNLEYIIIDGGSTDNTIEIIKKYEKFLAYWVSEPDRGQSNAINKGFRRATGLLVGWQNSDDFYHSGSLKGASKAWFANPGADVFYGNTVKVDHQSNYQGKFSPPDSNMLSMLPYNLINNQACFFKNNIFQSEYWLNENLHHSLDYEFNWRLILAGYTFVYVDLLSGAYRSHSTTKSQTQNEVFAREYALLYTDLLKNEALPTNVRKKALDCLYGLCLDNFLNLRREFRPSVRHLITVSGWQYVDTKLILKYLLSFLDPRVLQFFLQLRIQQHYSSIH